MTHGEIMSLYGKVIALQEVIIHIQKEVTKLNKQIANMKKPTPTQKEGFIKSTAQGSLDNGFNFPSFLQPLFS